MRPLPHTQYVSHVRMVELFSSYAPFKLTILNAGSTAGRLIPPFLADKLGVYNVLLPSILASAAMLFAIFGVSTSTGVVLEGILFGFFSGACESNVSPSSICH